MRDARRNPQLGGGGGGGGGRELRGILKTFAILLIFFLKWVKLFYDFRRFSVSSPLVPSLDAPHPLLRPLNLIQRVSPSRPRGAASPRSVIPSLSRLSLPLPQSQPFSFQHFAPCNCREYQPRLFFRPPPLSAPLAPFSRSTLFANYAETFRVFRAPAPNPSTSTLLPCQLIVSFSTTPSPISARSLISFSLASSRFVTPRQDRPGPSRALESTRKRISSRLTWHCIV